MDGKKRNTYRITKTGEEDQIGYLFDDNVMFWVKKGYRCTKIS